MAFTLLYYSVVKVLKASREFFAKMYYRTFSYRKSTLAWKLLLWFVSLKCWQRTTHRKPQEFGIVKPSLGLFAHRLQQKPQNFQFRKQVKNHPKQLLWGKIVQLHLENSRKVKLRETSGRLTRDNIYKNTTSTSLYAKHLQRKRQMGQSGIHCKAGSF